jgi:hypothetical protein
MVFIGLLGSALLVREIVTSVGNRVNLDESEMHLRPLCYEKVRNALQNATMARLWLS